MTPKQQRFVDEYLIDLNATAAYKRAGYRAKGHVAEAAASRMLRNVEVRRAVADAQKARAQRTARKADEVLEELAAVAFSDIGDVIDFSGDAFRLKKSDDIPEPARRALQTVKTRRYRQRRGNEAVEVEVTEYRFWPKMDALDKLGQHLGLWKQPDLELILADIPEPAHSQLRAALGVGAAAPALAYARPPPPPR